MKTDRRLRVLISLVAFTVVAFLIINPEQLVRAQENAPVPTERGLWSKQFGVPADSSALTSTLMEPTSRVRASVVLGSAATDSRGNIIVAGGTDGSLFGPNSGPQAHPHGSSVHENASSGCSDIVLIKYDSQSNALWSKQIGAGKDSFVHKILVDGDDNFFIVGATYDTYFGPRVGGALGSNAFVAKYDRNGDRLWSKQYGTGTDDDATSVGVDDQNNVYVVGYTRGSLFGSNASADKRHPDYDCFLVKYRSNGQVLWSKQFGARGNDLPAGLVVDGRGDIYVAGGTELLFDKTGNAAAFLAKFAPDGTLQWGRQFGSAHISGATGVCADDQGNAYVIGYVGAYTGPPDPDRPDRADDTTFRDGFVVKYDAAGDPVWSQQISTPDEDLPHDVRLDQAGNVLVCGYTKGSLFATNAGERSEADALPGRNEDAFVCAYAPDGEPLWGHQYGQAGTDMANCLCLDRQGGVYVVGSTQGSLFSTNAGGTEAFVHKISATGQVAMLRAAPRPARPIYDALGVAVIESWKSAGKPLTFAWAGRPTHLSYPPLLVASRPYLCAAYLSYGVPDARMTVLREKQVVISGQGRQIIIRPGATTYQLNGQTRRMTAKPVLAGGVCYVPLDVARAVLPVPIRYDAHAKQVRFDPPRLALR